MRRQRRIPPESRTSFFSRWVSHYEHLDEPAAAIATTFALHHLPDRWKGIALARMRSMLKPGGQLYIHDVILEQNNATEVIKAFIDQQSLAGETFSREMQKAIFSKSIQSIDWILDGLLARTGYRTVSKTIHDGVIGKYHCLRDARNISEPFRD